MQATSDADTPEQPDLTNLRWFFDHLELRDPDAAELAKQLVHRQEGWRVVSFLGPVQMDVWHLVVEGHGWRVRFGVERGYSDGVVATSSRGGERQRLASLAAARAWLERVSAAP